MTHPDVLGPGDERGRQPLGLAGLPQIRQAGKQLAEHRLDLDARNLGAEAEVLPSAAEGHMVAGRPGDVEALRLAERARIAIGGPVVRTTFWPALIWRPPSSVSAVAVRRM